MICPGQNFWFKMQQKISCHSAPKSAINLSSHFLVKIQIYEDVFLSFLDLNSAQFLALSPIYTGDVLSRKRPKQWQPNQGILKGEV